MLNDLLVQPTKQQMFDKYEENVNSDRYSSTSLATTMYTLKILKLAGHNFNCVFFQVRNTVLAVISTCQIRHKSSADRRQKAQR